MIDTKKIKFHFSLYLNHLDESKKKKVAIDYDCVKKNYLLES